jgi:hypothetical protein
MANINKKTKKLPKPFFWRRREQIAPEVGRLASAIEADQPKDHPRWRPTVWKTAALAALALIFLPSHANA